jgi:hypothetical protein
MQSSMWYRLERLPTPVRVHSRCPVHGWLTRKNNRGLVRTMFVKIQFVLDDASWPISPQSFTLMLPETR